MPDRPNFVILDEMNLAKVEYYFADFLSVLESRYVDNGRMHQSPLRLHDLPRCVLAQGESDWGAGDGSAEIVESACLVRCEGCPLRHGVVEEQWSRGETDYIEALSAGFNAACYVPPRLYVPANVYFSGTVNVDETTYMFSPKVLDRANTIEFNEVDLDSYFAPKLDVNGADAAHEGIRAAFTFDGKFVRLPKTVALLTDERLAAYRDRLKVLNRSLVRANMHFGYRVVDEILLYLWNTHQLNDPGFDLEVAFDHQLCQKVLPKFHGSQAKLQEPLETLLTFCIAPEREVAGADGGVVAADREHIGQLKGQSVEALRSSGVHYPYAAHKIRQMLDALEKEGFASFA